MFAIGKKLIIFFLSGFFVISALTLLVHAQAPTIAPSPTPDSKQMQDLNNKIRELEGKISDLHSQADSLNSQIEVMDSQMKLTEYRMNATQQQITDLALDIDSATKRMKSLESSLDDVTKVLINRIVATYQTGGVNPMHILLASDSVSDFFARSNYLKIVQEHDKRLIYDTQQAKNDYANQKTIFENKKKKVEALKTQLEEYSKQLEEEKKSKEKLLAETQGNEKVYQKLLADARAQIAGFKSFARSQGGSILPPQASPDGWYYNQRDERWGNNNIGNSSERMWEVGCLVTSTAMLRKQKGENITPADVARESSYYSLNTAAMKIPWNGGKFTSVWSSDLSTIDSRLANGPVIVGIKVNNNAVGTHFLVLKSGSGGNYIMNDPWNGPDLKFSDYYSTGQIFQYGYLN